LENARKTTTRITGDNDGPVQGGGNVAFDGLKSGEGLKSFFTEPVYGAGYVYGRYGNGTRTATD
jgi:hypothetical protein